MRTLCQFDTQYMRLNHAYSMPFRYTIITTETVNIGSPWQRNAHANKSLHPKPL